VAEKVVKIRHAAGLWDVEELDPSLLAIAFHLNHLCLLVCKS
jgi:hypothetical protein